MGVSQTVRFILSHPMNRGRPFSAFARFLKWQIQSRIQDEVVFDWINGAKLAVKRGMTGATGNIYCGLHEYVDMRFVLDTLGPQDLFADIGANIGSYTILASKVCGARTIAFEPDPGTANSLMKNVELNGLAKQVRVVEAALGASSGKISFTVGRDTVNRVAQAQDANTREVSLRTLDDVLSGEVPRVIKIDVEGFEAQVFQGASETLADHRLEAIITEAHDEQVNSILERAGFRRRYYDPEKKMLIDSPRFHSHNALMIRD